ncbi:hypothetical protein LWI28_009431 [Acer negundo]|uniref:mannan endo-1,4-beta-mannosidase n=1 Tax=Acer negundo TaxID=4023 RepID=A0AAD5IZ82_ACENE|nr:hypothetical protein LWI28_009431 [Acer negundo]
MVVLIFQHGDNYWVRANSDRGFTQINGTYFVMNGKPMNLNGFNAYWMMLHAADPSTRSKVTVVFQQASKYGMNIARAWAFSDGGDRPLQSSPGVYNENTFKGLDFVVSEAGKYGVSMILSFVNNYEDYGGRKQYVNWALERGQPLKNEDEFYTNPAVKQYYKNHVMAVLTRKNSVTGVVYKDDPTIFAWELINEPRNPSDPSGGQLQNWIQEMAAYVKSIDNNHLLEVGLEGFYGNSVPERKQYNPNDKANVIGTDFIANSQVAQVDFATIHIYAEHWLPQNTSEEAQQIFVDRWIQSHIEDSKSVIKKPIVIGEFGKSYKMSGYSLEKRNSYFEHVYNAVYASAKDGGPCIGGLFWQLMTRGMVNMADGYDVILEESPSTAQIIAQQSHRMIGSK